MKIISNNNEFLCGIYNIEMENNAKANELISRFKTCPNWPIVIKGIRDNEVFVLAIELKKQQHGDFSEQKNLLVKKPEIIGAKKIGFTKINNIETLFGKYQYKTGYMEKVPCGTDCFKCPIYKKPCNGCPAIFDM